MPPPRDGRPLRRRGDRDSGKPSPPSIADRSRSRGVRARCGTTCRCQTRRHVRRTSSSSSCSPIFSDPGASTGPCASRRSRKSSPASCDVRWKSFLLRPYPEPRTLEEFRAYTESWRRPAAQEDAGRFTVWSTEEPPPSHSVPPAIAAKAAARQGADAFARYHRALMENYFHSESQHHRAGEPGAHRRGDRPRRPGLRRRAARPVPSAARWWTTTTRRSRSASTAYRP